MGKVKLLKKAYNFIKKKDLDLTAALAGFGIAGGTGAAVLGKKLKKMDDKKEKKLEPKKNSGKSKSGPPQKKKLDKKPFYGEQGSKGYFNPSLTGKDFAESGDRTEGKAARLKDEAYQQDKFIMKAEKARRIRAKNKAKPMGKKHGGMMNSRAIAKKYFKGGMA